MSENNSSKTELFESEKMVDEGTGKPFEQISIKLPEK